jgi:hypothetical protein
MRIIRLASIVFVLALTFVMSGFGPAATAQQRAGQPRDNERSGQAIFRFDTFGDEQLWTDGCECTKSWRRSIRRPR